MENYRAAARLEGSKLTLLAPNAFLEAMRRLPDGDYVVVLRRSNERQRSLAQNAYLHAVVFPLVAEWQGQGVAETKLDLMGECWGWKESKMGHLIPEKPSTSGMTVEECAAFIEWVVPWCGQQGIRVPLPGEFS